MPERDTNQQNTEENLLHNKLHQPNNQCKSLLSHAKQGSVNAKVEVNHEEIRKDLSNLIKTQPNYKNIRH